MKRTVVLVQWSELGTVRWQHICRLKGKVVVPVDRGLFPFGRYLIQLAILALIRDRMGSGATYIRPRGPRAGKRVTNEGAAREVSDFVGQHACIVSRVEIKMFLYGVPPEEVFDRWTRRWFAYRLQCAFYWMQLGALKVRNVIYRTYFDRLMDWYLRDEASFGEPPCERVSNDMLADVTANLLAAGWSHSDVFEFVKVFLQMAAKMPDGRGKGCRVGSIQDVRKVLQRAGWAEGGTKDSALQALLQANERGFALREAGNQERENPAA